MQRNNDTYTFFAILAFLAAIFITTGIIAGSLEFSNQWWMMVLAFGLGVGFTGAAINAERKSSSTAIVASTSSLTMPGTEVVEKKAPKPAPAQKAKSKNEADDLTKLEGIGPKMSKALIAGGIATFEKLASMNEDEIRVVLDEQGQRFSPSAESWPEQAGYAAKDDWDGLEKLQSILVSGRYPDDYNKS